MADRQNVQYPFTAIEPKDNPVSTHAEFEPTFQLTVQRFAHGWIFRQGIKRRTN